MNKEKAELENKEQSKKISTIEILKSDISHKNKFIENGVIPRRALKNLSNSKPNNKNSGAAPPLGCARSEERR